MTRAIANAMITHCEFGVEIASALIRYLSGDWGDLNEHDANLNECAVRENSDRIFAAYETPYGKIWIITEWDRSYTTILFSSDY